MLLLDGCRYICRMFRAEHKSPFGSSGVIKVQPFQRDGYSSCPRPIVVTETKELRRTQLSFRNLGHFVELRQICCCLRKLDMRMPTAGRRYIQRECQQAQDDGQGTTALDRYLCASGDHNKDNRNKQQTEVEV